MKIKILGTAAAEGVPAMFCNCENCVKARALKGKNLRSRAQALINDDLLIDFGPDTYLNGQRFGIDLSAVKYFLITHTHSDHHCAYDFDNINAATDRTQEKVNILGPEMVMNNLRSVIPYSMSSLFDSGKVVFSGLEAFKKQQFGDYCITPLKAYHQQGAFVYIIERDGKSIFYCLDTGKLPDEDHEYLATLKKAFDLVIIDCTYGRVPADKYGGHMSLYDDAKQIELMKRAGAVDENTKVIVNHFAHWHIPSHDEMQEMADEFGYTVAYDGIEIEV